MIIRAREVIPGAILVWDIPIRPGVTGSLCDYDHWHWAQNLELLRPGELSYIEKFQTSLTTPRSHFDEYSRVNTPVA